MIPLTEDRKMLGYDLTRETKPKLYAATRK